MIKKKKELFIGKVGIGGNNPISIQSMSSTDTRDVKATLNQITQLAGAGCDIIRVAVPSEDAITPLKQIVESSPLPVIGDIHFDARLALQSIAAGVHGIRINPGNIGDNRKLKEILTAANEKKIPIRIGVNSGSLEKKYLNSSKPLSMAQKMVSSVLDKIKFFEDNHFFNIKLSLKSSNVSETVQAYRLVDQACDYPLHLGITEAGTFFSGTVKSAVGIGSLLLDGIGNTIRVSLTDNPLEEIKVAKEILKVTGHRNSGIEIISCPTCSRTTVDLISIVNQVEKELSHLKTTSKITVAIMGCEVNGPGEAKEADMGIAFSKSYGYIFKKGKMLEKVSPVNAIPQLMKLIKKSID